MEHICVGMVAHVDSGKTTLSENILYRTGSIRSLGRVDHGNTFLDTYELERQRGITIFSKQAVLTVDDTTITLLDTPGHVDFAAEAENMDKVIDAIGAIRLRRAEMNVPPSKKAKLIIVSDVRFYIQNLVF